MTSQASQLCVDQRVFVGGAAAVPDQLAGGLLRCSWGDLALGFQILQWGPTAIGLGPGFT